MSEPDWEMIADGLALFQEHAPQSGEDWVAVAGRCLADGEFGLNGSPLFRALMIQTHLLARERERTTALREALGDLRDAANRTDVALAEVDSTAMRIADHPDGDEWVGSYFLRCGPWHRVLGCRSQLAYGIGKAKAALAASSPAEQEQE